jgi:hypothetical protein
MLQLGIEGEKVCTQSGGAVIPSDPALRSRTLGIVPGETTVPLPFPVVALCGNTLPADSYVARAER